MSIVEEDRGDALLAAPPVDAAPSQLRCRCCATSLALPKPRLFVAKTLFIWAASYAFIPLIVANNRGRITAVAYAIILVVLHALFIVIYFYRVEFRALDPNWRSLAARCVGLGCSVLLLFVVALYLPEKIAVLALYLLGLCVVHTSILLLLTVKVVGDDGGRGKGRRSRGLPVTMADDETGGSAAESVGAGVA